MLASLDASLPEGSPLREALTKAGLALSVAFADGHRERIENVYMSLSEPLSEEQRARLTALGIDPRALGPVVAYVDHPRHRDQHAPQERRALAGDAAAPLDRAALELLVDQSGVAGDLAGS